MPYVRCSNGGGVSSLKDFYRDKVLNGTFDVTLDMTPNAQRITLNEGGKVGIDTTNRIGYFYVDCTTIVASVTNDWRVFGSFGSAFSNYLPRFASNTRNYQVSLTVDETSDSTPCCFLGYGSSSNPRVFGTGYAETFAIGDRIIAYGSWTY